MSHFPVIVIVPADAPDPTEAAANLLAPYDEDGAWGADGTRWDWWVVGGRWTGSLDGYDPTADPANQEVCELCHGTGRRPFDATPMGGGPLGDESNPSRPRWDPDDDWGRECGGCNGCQGKGTRLAWRLQPHAGDILPVSDVGEKFMPHAIVTPDGAWHEGERMGWFAVTRAEADSAGADAWPRLAAELLLAHRDHVAVLVDCHV